MKEITIAMATLCLSKQKAIKVEWFGISLVFV